MSYEIETIPNFDKELKRLAKKYQSIKNDVIYLSDKLADNPKQGVSLGYNCHKIRMAIKSKGRGKSGSARIITLVKVVNETIYLLSVYDKSDKDTISDKEILKLIEQIDTWKS